MGHDETIPIPRDDYASRPGEYVVGIESDSIKETVNMVPSVTESELGTVYKGMVTIPSASFSGSGYEEAGITVGPANAMIVEGQGIATRIRGTGDHTITTTGTDQMFRDLWIDNMDAKGSGFDAIQLGKECTLSNVDIDDAARYGANITGARAKIVNTQLLGGIEGAIFLNSTYATISNIVIQSGGQKTLEGPGILTGGSGGLSHVSNAYLRNLGAEGIHTAATGSGGNTFMGVRVDSPGQVDTTAHGVWFESSINSFYGSVYNAPGDGIHVDGNENQIVAAISGSTGNAVTIDGDYNVVYVTCRGDVVLNGSNNVVAGVTRGTVTDNGTGNDTSELN